MISKCIVIPIYKLIISDDEIISLRQCFKNLSNHKIIFVGPIGIDISFYKKILNKEDLVVEYFEKYYFENIKGYNQLMLSKTFYERFINYDYMLIHQLDCYIFKDELDYWCNLGYDYIGAPWFNNEYYNKSKIKKILFLIYRRMINLFSKYYNKNILVNNVGNGGFSLRKISVFLKKINSIDQKKIKKFQQSNDPTSIFNEDVFWSFEANIKKPNYKEAAKFALDTDAYIGMRMNNNILPFGCHAWNKNYNYWHKFIKY